MAESMEGSPVSISPDSEMAESMEGSPVSISPDSELFSRSPTPESNDSLSNEMIELKLPLKPTGRMAPFPTFNISPIPFMQTENETGVCVEYIENFIPDDGTEVTRILQMRIPEIKKMDMMSKEMMHIASNLCSSLRSKSELCDENRSAFTDKESELFDVYIMHNKNLANYSEELVDLADSLVSSFDDLLLWCVQVTEDYRITGLELMKERLYRKLSDWRKLKDSLIYVSHEYRQFRYKKKISCLVILCNELTIKMLELITEVRNLDYFLSKTIEVKNAEANRPPLISSL